MKVFIAIDSFKGTLTSQELGHIMATSLEKNNIETKAIPITDGGEGFLDFISTIIPTKTIHLEVKGPLGAFVDAIYLVDKKTHTAYIELAKACGHHLVSEQERNVMESSTFGLGELILHASTQQVKHIIIGLGGSATNDGGSGMLEALGCIFYNKQGQKINHINARKLGQIAQVDTSALHALMKKVDFTAVHDVVNPLLGKFGASRVYGVQKGATSHNAMALDNYMVSYASIIDPSQTFINTPGSGAAGGVGFACLACLQAKPRLGIDYVLDIVNFDEEIKNYDAIITGEGSFDEQSMYGKVVGGIVMRAQNKKVIVVCGVNKMKHPIPEGIHKIAAIVPKIASLEEALLHPQENFRKLCNSLIV